VFHVSGSCGQDPRVPKLDTVTRFMLYLAITHLSGWYNLNVSVVLLEPCLNGMPSLTNVGLTTFIGMPDASYFHTKVISDWVKETGNLPRQEAYSFEVVSLLSYECSHQGVLTSWRCHQMTVTMWLKVTQIVWAP
jgi:hypothetical protein